MRGMERSEKIIAVGVNRPVRRLFSYRVPPEMAPAAVAGVRVKVPFGHARTAIGYVVEDAPAAPDVRLKDVLDVLDSEPLLDPPMLRLARFMSRYYFCSVGEALEAMLPANVRGRCSARREKSFLARHTGEKLDALIAEKLANAPAVANALRFLARFDGEIRPEVLAQKAGVSLSSVNKLAKAGLVNVVYRENARSPFDHAPVGRETDLELVAGQQAAFDLIAGNMPRGHFVALLLGVTGSGKTEVYLQLIREVVKTGRQAIVLVPEISLTPQTVARFRSRFGRVAVLHSHLTNAERHGQWKIIRRGDADVVIGPRSAVFAPVPNLGLIVVDEEHENTFKQQNSPRYHARDIAVWRGKNENAPVILGSASPSLETYRNAIAGKYVFAKMNERIAGRPLPPVTVVDMLDEFTEASTGSIISRRLSLALKKVLDEKKQAILFLNRRGFHTFVTCRKCGFVLRCPSCDVAMTHHKRYAAVICHYCCHQENPPAACPQCGAAGIRYFGYGTEKIEAEIAKLLPAARVARLDGEVAMKRGAHAEVLDHFKNGAIDILVGTQMIAKGLDFPRVSLVGIISADSMLNLPDFRSAERTFDLIMQVAGRAGRGEHPGTVILQTETTGHYAIECAMRHDYAGFSEIELEFRKKNRYPPFWRLVRIVFEGADEKKTVEHADAVARALKKIADCMNREERPDPDATVAAAGEAMSAGSFDPLEQLRAAGLFAAPCETETPEPPARIAVLGPSPCPLERIRNEFRRHVIAKCRYSRDLLMFVDLAEKFISSRSNLRVTVDVDPVSMM